MARDHGRVLCSIWNDPDFLALSNEAQRMYLLVLSQPTVNNAGVLPLMVSKWTKKGHLAEDVVRSCLYELEDARFIVTDTDTDEVLIRSFIRNDGGLKHRYILKNALGCAEAAESAVIRGALVSELQRLDNPSVKAVADRMRARIKRQINPSESHSDPILIPSESPRNQPLIPMPLESHSNHYGVGEGVGEGDLLLLSPSKDFVQSSKNDYPKPFEEFWTHYPRKEEKRKSFLAWEKATTRATRDAVIAGADRYADDPNREAKYTKLAATWLNGDCWLDEPLPGKSNPNSHRDPSTGRIHEGW